MKKKNIKEETNDFFDFETEETSQKKSSISAPHTLTIEEVMNSSDSKKSIQKSHNALDMLKKRVTGAFDEVKEQTSFDIVSTTTEIKKVDSTPSAEPPVQKDETKILDENKTLLDKCRHFLVDDDGTKVSPNNEPLYKLQSVAEILKSDGEKILEKLSEEYDVFFDDLTPNTNNATPKKDNKTNIPKPKTETVKNNTPKKTEPVIETVKEEKPIIEVKPVENKFEDTIVISDIDTPESNPKPKIQNIDDSMTITFTPVNDGKSDKKINIITHTRAIDITGEFAEIPNISSEQFSEKIELEENEFEEYIPNEEITDNKDILKFLRQYSIKKRKSFISMTISVLTTIILALSWIPFFQSLIIANTSTAMIVSSAIILLSVLFNLDAFKSFKKIFLKDSNYDISVGFSILTITAYSVFGILASENIIPMLLFLNIVLFFRGLGIFMNSSVMVSNLKILSSNTSKNTLKLINDSAITYNMAERLIDGDVLIAGTQETDDITDFMKYSTFGKFLNGKTPIINAISVMLSAVIGIICGIYFDGLIHGFYAAAVIQCLTALPSSFLIDNLPLYRASKKLSISGAMILGKYGAEQVECANAAVINANKIFPDGSITLHQMQALSANNLEDTIVRAASLTEALGSTLAPIFKTIAGTGNITALPDSDTVKYEDRMGISGWVDNRLLFIGNRALLETHGIPVPSLEVDKKILRQGYFPVYVATQEKACALIIIQYNVKEEIADELRHLTDSGVDLLVSSSDPNLTEEMICDYFGLYNDSVKILTAAGRHTHRNITAKAKTVSAPAVVGRNCVGIIKVLNCAARIRKSNTLLIFSYILSLVFGTVVFAYASLGGSGNLLSSSTVLIYLGITTVISFLLYLFKRP